MALTSITDAKTRKFLTQNGVKERKTLNCTRIKGFHLIKLAHGGSWRYRYRDALGKVRTVTIGRYPAFKPEVAAQKALDLLTSGTDVLQERHTHRQRAISKQAMAKARAIETYLEGDYAAYQSRKKSGKQTLAMIRRSFSDFLERDMSTLNADDIKAWQKKEEAQGLRHKTIERHYSALTTMLYRAADVGLIESNPLAKVRLEAATDAERARLTSAEYRAKRRMLTPDEIAKLYKGLGAFAEEIRAQRRSSRKHGKPYLPDLDAVPFPHWFIPFCHLALHTGLRTGDLISLTWLELNINFKRLDKVPEKTRHHAAPAIVRMQLPPQIMGIMRAWWEQQGKPTEGYVFTSRRTGGCFTKGAHKKPWAHVKKLGGLDDDLVFYSLRHHFISALVSQGVPMLTVARLAGHKSTAMIEQHYGHLSPTQASDALQALSNSLVSNDKSKGAMA